MEADVERYDIDTSGPEEEGKAGRKRHLEDEVSDGKKSKNACSEKEREWKTSKVSSIYLAKQIEA